MIGSQSAIELRGVGLLRQERWILRDINWNLPAGRCAAILGPNGSGKSTLARILACHLWPTVGDCVVLNNHFGDADLATARKGLRLIQPAGPYDIDPSLTAREVVMTGFFGTLSLYNSVTEAMRAKADQLLDGVGLSRVADNRYEQLSSGERVRSLIARAMADEPALLLLDEPTAGLDLLAREQVLATVQSLFERNPQPPTVVLITHHVEELPPATSEVLLLSGGTVAASGSPQQVLDAGILSRVYGCPVEVTRRDGRYSVHVHPRAWSALLKRPG